MTNTEAPSIDLERIEKAAEKAAKVPPLPFGTALAAWDEHRSVALPHAVLALVAAVKAARDYVADHGQDVVEPECVSCKALLDALHPFTVTK